MPKYTIEVNEVKPSGGGGCGPIIFWGIVICIIIAALSK
jgi:hypothetical protein